jgi:hypothetical protein
VTDLPTEVIRFPTRLRLIDCQGEGSPLMSQLEASAGISADLAAMRAKHRRASKARNKIADGFCELVEEVGLDDAHNWLRTLLDGEKAS